MTNDTQVLCITHKCCSGWKKEATQAAVFYRMTFSHPTVHFFLVTLRRLLKYYKKVRSNTNILNNVQQSTSDPQLDNSTY